MEGSVSSRWRQLYSSPCSSTRRSSLSTACHPPPPIQPPAHHGGLQVRRRIPQQTGGGGLSPASLPAVTLQSSSWKQAARTPATPCSIPVTPSLSLQGMAGAGLQGAARWRAMAATASWPDIRKSSFLNMSKLQGRSAAMREALKPI